jgi:hypothetical protein
MREAVRQPSYWLTGVLAVLLLVEAVAGLVLPDLYRDAPGWAAQARGVNLVDLVGILPTLVVAMALAARRSWCARIVCVGSSATSSTAR